jgi:KaiC/GvpD/RAD55 family RecA-like ATPase
MFALVRWLRTLQATTFLLGELPTDPQLRGGTDAGAFAKQKEEYLVDGIVHLRMARQGDFGMQRQLRVVKMRGSRHDSDYHALVFDNGFKVTRILA